MINPVLMLAMLAAILCLALDAAAQPNPNSSNRKERADAQNRKADDVRRGAGVQQRRGTGNAGANEWGLPERSTKKVPNAWDAVDRNCAALRQLAIVGNDIGGYNALMAKVPYSGATQAWPGLNHAERLTVYSGWCGFSTFETWSLSALYFWREGRPKALPPRAGQTVNPKHNWSTSSASRRSARYFSSQQASDYREGRITLDQLLADRPRTNTPSTNTSSRSPSEPSANRSKQPPSGPDNVQPPAATVLTTAESTSDAAHQANKVRAQTRHDITPGESALGVRIGMTAAEVVAVLGTPSGRQRVTNDAHQLQPLRFTGITVYFLVGQVVAIEVGKDALMKSRAITGDGIGYLTSKRQLLASMGAPDSQLSKVWKYTTRGVSFHMWSDVKYITVFAPMAPLAMTITPGVGVGPAKLGAPCAKAAAAMGLPYHTFHGNPIVHHFGPRPGYGPSLWCGPGATLAKIKLPPPFSGSDEELVIEE